MIKGTFQKGANAGGGTQGPGVRQETRTGRGRRSAQDDQRNVLERSQCRRGHTGTWRPTGDTDRERPGELLHLHGRVAATRMTSLDWPLQDIGLLQSFCERQLIIHVLPPPPAMPTLLQYYCTTIAQCTPPDPRCEFHIAYNVGNGNIV